jgi:4-amino-4-deoxy-L-arabinose transferase-like glycosyltransferase
MRVVPPEAWQPFFTRPAFYQAPLYSYFLALLMRVGGDAALWARMIQIGLGVANTGLIYGITRRPFGRRAAVAAGLIMAAYGPLLVIESQLLRDTLVLTLMLAVFFLYQAWTLDRKTPGAWRWPLGLGALLGVLATAHEGAMMLGVAIVAAGWLHARSKTKRSETRISAARWAALLALGALAGYGPLLARNLIVGAPAGPRFAGSAFAFAVANHATAAWGGATWISPTPEFGLTIARSGGNAVALVGGVLGSYHGEWWRWVGHWLTRLGALALGAENNENVCQAYFAMRVPILAFSVDFRLLLPLALAGGIGWGWRRWRAAVRGGSPALALAVDGVLVTLMLSLVLPLGRYRLMLLPALVPFAGRAAVGMLAALHGRRWKALAWTAGLAALVAAGQWGLGRALPFGGLRPVDFNIAAKMLLDWGHPELALRELGSGVQAGLDPQAFELETAIVLDAAGREAEAAGLYERALARPTRDPLALQRLGWLRAAARDPQTRQPQEAGELARQYAALKPESGADAMDLLAAAAAARGDFSAARADAEQALAAARRQGRLALAGQIAKRIELYRQGRPFVR